MGIQATQRTEQREALRRQINRLTSLGYPYEIVLHFGKLSGNTHIKERKRLRLIWDIARTPGCRAPSPERKSRGTSALGAADIPLAKPFTLFSNQITSPSKP